jgi:hypothetical protein
LTLRELLLMAEGRQQERWQHTASLLALIANCHRDPKRRRPYTPEDFLPKTRERTQPLPDLSLLKAVFVDRTTPKGTPT